MAMVRHRQNRKSSFRLLNQTRARRLTAIEPFFIIDLLPTVICFCVLLNALAVLTDNEICRNV